MKRLFVWDHALNAIYFLFFKRKKVCSQAKERSFSEFALAGGGGLCEKRKVEAKRGKRDTWETEKLKIGWRGGGKQETLETDEEIQKKTVRLFCFPSLPF